MGESERGSGPDEAAENAAAESEPSYEQFEDWTPPPAQLLRVAIGLGATALGAALYGYVLLNFWSSPSLGIHTRTPWPAYLAITGALLLALTGLRIGLGIWSPHAKLGVSLLALLACAAIGVGGARFYLYASRGTLNPDFTLKLAPSDPFPRYALPDQSDRVHTDAELKGSGHLIVVYRGDYCPFGRYELHELTERRNQFAARGVDVIAISADPVARSKMLAGFLKTPIPLLGDPSGKLLGPLGLLQHHRNDEPDNAIPAFVLVDRDGVVRWIFTSPYYREEPSMEALLKAAADSGVAH